MSEEKEVVELPEDIEVIGPGQMLAEARESLGLTQQQVADRLNFRTTLVKEIEQEIFDQSLPSTFNRGYLKNYAKLVNISVDEVLESYEMLNVAHKQGAEMQSFSKQTEKQAESNRIMWISYLILALLIGATIMWWLQDSDQNKVEAVSANQPEVVNTADEVSQVSKTSSNLTPEQAVAAETDTDTDNEQTTPLSDTLIANVPTTEQVDEQVTEAAQNQIAKSESTESNNDALASEDDAITTVDFGAPEQAQFTFSGDCWVNIYDATGERIAWGIKKSGYVMNISGQAPFTITLGKPELVSIVYQQASVDMSQFSSGNIAKFTLPLE
ncbi:RodZ domain-containing protein [Thalassotalea sp. G2M2-11]|uniref:RodZ domain-containing protein n=1 Tax=Thalassotalea sp. G2M2-11 TaxID=2787627 RepID=UPI0019D2DA2F|nr:RodZ domain-containing protein [Thalassotalea sp. G2M2-11]